MLFLIFLLIFFFMLFWGALFDFLTDFILHYFFQAPDSSTPSRHSKSSAVASSASGGRYLDVLPN
jgi:hypothetical protein